MKRVLVVNDSPFERLIMKDMISRLGYEAKSTDEYSTMNLIDSYDPNIVIANMTMNKTSGDKLIAAIKVKKPGIKCYLSSCSQIRADKLQYPDVDGCIETPVSPGRLNRILCDKDEDVCMAEQDTEPQELSLRPANTPALTLENQDPAIKQAEKEQAALGNDIGNQPVKASFAFCPYCGEKMAESQVKYVFCPFCGSKF